MEGICPEAEHQVPCALKAFFEKLCCNGTSCSASQAPSCMHFHFTIHKFLSHCEALDPTPPWFERAILRYARAFPLCPQHWLLCHLSLY